MGHRRRHLDHQQRQLARARRRRQSRENQYNIATLRTPLPQNNSYLFDLQPYFQATHVPAYPSLGWYTSGSTFGVALLTNYDIGGGFNLGGRLEYISSTGSTATAPNLLYGPGSGAFSFTLTPAYQWKYFFARAEFS